MFEGFPTTRIRLAATRCFIMPKRCNFIIQNVNTLFLATLIILSSRFVSLFYMRLLCNCFLWSALERRSSPEPPRLHPTNHLPARSENIHVAANYGQILERGFLALVCLQNESSLSKHIGHILGGQKNGDELAA